MEDILNKITDFILLNLPNKYLSIIFISFIPLIEARGAVPLALNMGISPIAAIFLTSLSAIIFCPLLLMMFEPLLAYLKSTRLFKSLAYKIEEIFKLKANQIDKKSHSTTSANITIINNREIVNYHRKLWLIFTLVAIPLPMTGIWTGCIVAVFLFLPIKSSFPVLVLGNITSSAIICLLSMVLGKYSYLILLLLMIFILITIIFIIFKVFSGNKKRA